MGSKAERVTRFDEKLFATAAAEGARQSRSARQQLEHWARLGAALSAQTEAPVNRVRLALEGAIAQRDLTVDEARQLDAQITVRIDDAVERADFASAPLPDFSAAAPAPHQVLAELAELAAGNPASERARTRLRAALEDVRRAIAEDEEPVEARR